MKKIVFLLALLAPGISHAYLGPGIGAGTLGVIVGFFVAIFLAIVALFWYPIKRLFKKKKITDGTATTDNDPASNHKQVEQEDQSSDQNK